MSIIDRTGQAVRGKRWRDVQVASADGQPAPRPRAPFLAAMLRNRPLRIALVWSGLAWLVLETLFLGWVYRNCEGDSHRAFLPGTVFGQTELEAAANLRPVSKIGYDGQLYYRVSNDLLGRGDAYKHLDSFLYRYQRIGVPMLAGMLATLLRFPMTPPLLYHSLQFGLTAAGFGGLVYWLVSNKLSPAYALGWLLSGGTLFALWQGLLDSSADAFFVFTFLAMLNRRLLFYAPLATMLVLMREGYVVYPFAIFLVALVNRYQWSDVENYWQRLVLTALPGAVPLAWMIYLAVHFNASTIAHFNNPDMTAAPFAGMIECLTKFYRTNNWLELWLGSVSAGTLILVCLMMVRNVRRLPLALACMVPYLLLTTCLGRTVWEAFGGSMKATGTVVIVGLFMTGVDHSVLLRFMLAVQALTGVEYLASERVLHQRLISPDLIREESGYESNKGTIPDNMILTDLRSAVTWSAPEPVVRRNYQGAWDWFYREVRPIQVSITNNSEAIWQPGLGAYPIWLSATIYDESGERQLCQHSVLLDRALAPGETAAMSVCMELRRPGRKYVMELSMWQDGAGWFVRRDPGFGSRYEFTVE